MHAFFQNSHTYSKISSIQSQQWAIKLGRQAGEVAQTCWGKEGTNLTVLSLTLILSQSLQVN